MQVRVPIRSRFAPAIALLIAAAPLTAADYLQVLPGSELNPDPGTWTSTSGTFNVIEGTTAYSHFAKNNAPREFVIEKTTGLGGSRSTSILTDLASWTSDVSPYPGPTSERIFGGYGTEIVGNSIQIPDTSSSSVYRVDKTSGLVSVYLTNDQLKAAAGGATATIGTTSGTAPSGEAIIYESVTKQLLLTTGPGSASVLVNTADLASVIPGSGLTYDNSGNLYWGVNGSGLYQRSSGGTISEILSSAQILSVLGGTGTTWGGDVFYAPDGLIYFRYGSSSNNQGILSFDPANALSTLSVVLSRAQLISGPAGSATAGPFAWYDGNIGWTLVGAPSGFYAVPEPSAMLLLVAGASFLLRRRR